VGFIWLFLRKQRGVESSMAGRRIDMGIISHRDERLGLKLTIVTI
jgi:hypothetical protein